MGHGCWRVFSPVADREAIACSDFLCLVQAEQCSVSSVTKNSHSMWYTEG